MNIQAIIFDMDGVLLDSEPLHFIAMNRALADEGAEIAEDEYRGYIGDTARNAWAAIIARRGLPAPIETYLARYTAAVVAVIAEGAEPMPGLLPLLADLRAAGVPLAVGSSSPRPWVTVSLDAIGVRDYFAEIVSGEMVAHSKPAPDIYLRAAEGLGVDPAGCLVIEDSALGLAAARAAGMFAVALRPPAHGLAAPPDVRDADLVVDSLADFHAWFLNTRPPPR
jgi:HAD superfamily hydrolase (TIGR01509 family)